METATNYRLFERLSHYKIGSPTLPNSQISFAFQKTLSTYSPSPADSTRRLFPPSTRHLFRYIHFRSKTPEAVNSNDLQSFRVILSALDSTTLVLGNFSSIKIMEFERHLPQEWKSIPAVNTETEKISACFDCSICLDFARDPVVTLCGHLYCWPCIYQWLKFPSNSISSDECAPCPVCKAEISNASIVPLYGRGKTLSENECRDNAVIPPRPIMPARPFQRRSSHDGGQLPNHNSHGSYQNFAYPETMNGVGDLPQLGNTTANTVCHPMVGMFGEMVYARVFGNSESLYSYPNSYYTTGRRSARLRRQEIIANKSLSRVSFFLFCCVVLCFILF